MSLTTESLEQAIQHVICFILGDPGAVSGGGEKSKNGRKKIRAKKSQERGTFLHPNFFSPVLRLFPVPTNCPWVSEDGSACAFTHKNDDRVPINTWVCTLFTKFKRTCRFSGNVLLWNTRTEEKSSENFSNRQRTPVKQKVPSSLELGSQVPLTIKSSGNSEYNCTEQQMLNFQIPV